MTTFWVASITLIVGAAWLGLVAVLTGWRPWE